VQRHAAEGADDRTGRQALTRRRITVRIARRGIENQERLDRFCRVVERTLAWLNRSRRLTVREERRAAIHEAFLYFGCVQIGLNDLPERC
jgi:transposase